LTVFGAVYALGAPLVVRAARAVRPERLAAGALALFAVANAATAAAPSYAALLGARVLAAACAGVFMPTAALVAARAVSEEQRGRALAFVVGGSSAATALGVPLGTFVGGAVGWRAVFYAVAIASALIAAAATSLPRTERPPAGPGTRVLATLATTLLWATGSFTFFAYVAVVLARRASVGTAGLAAFLLLFGLVGIVGAAAAGRLTDTRGPIAPLVGGLLLIAVALAGLAAATGRVAAVLLVALYAFGTWAVTPPQQHRLLGAGGDTSFLLSLNASALYGGVALGSGLGGVILAATGSVAALCGVAAALELLAVASVWATPM
jgi:MFS transporter, DHA1 family, inner membrane transport protein